MLYKLGSRGNVVKDIQDFLGISADGIYGEQTVAAVEKWQYKNGLIVDGIVGGMTLSKMGLIDTDMSLSNQFNFNFDIVDFEKSDTTLKINEFFMHPHEYINDDIIPEYVFLHHTAGWHNPYNTIKGWESDNRGTIATEFVIGGQSVKNNNNKYDGELVQSFPAGNYAWHLGKTGSQYMHIHSIGIELCNFGWVVNNKNWAGVLVDSNQIVKLNKPFRGYEYWHKYSDNQIYTLKNLLLYIADRNNIDITDGLPKLIRKYGADAFDWNESAYFGDIKGILSHSNVRKDKFDIFPQPELMDMLISI